MKYLLLIPLFVLVSCHKQSATINEMFDNAFQDSVVKSGVKLQLYQAFPDWKAKVYLKDKQIKLLHITSMGELASSDIQVYFTPKGKVEKIVNQRHLPDWESQTNKNAPPVAYKDTTYVFFPTTHQKLKYDSYKSLPLVASDSLYTSGLLKSIDFYIDHIYLDIK